MKKQNFSTIGENSSSVHNLYELNGNHCDATDVKLVWRNLSCKVNTTNLRKWKSFPWFKFQRCSKTILQEQSGSIKVGVLTAVVGPSGAGKSTFLECLSGKKRTTRKGDVYVTSANIKTKIGTFNSSIEDIRQLSVSFIAQKDHLIGVLTVRESLLFASKLKNYKEKWEVTKGRRESLKSKGIKTIEDFHTYVVETVLSEFGLEGCSDVFVNKCSGGQAKRLSIALELVSRPKILILDEPTSGLDSSSALQCVQVLKQLTVTRSNMKAPLAIIASIHQPSARLLYEFENVYILSNDGRCLYHGSVSNLLTHFSRFGLQCPQFHNPADFIMEVATATYGTKCMDELALYERRQQAIESVEEEHKQKYKITYIVDKMTKQRFPTFLHAWLLLQRTWKNTIREPMLTWLRLIQHVVVALVASYMYNYKVGEANGCFSDLTEAFHFNATSQPGSLGDIQEKFIRQQSAALTNVGLAYFTILFLAFANSSATCLTFPLEMSNAGILGILVALILCPNL
ncbi:ABC transporter sub-family G-like protein 1 [Leptotrombidium deliense]|uniref:ABC transporter sub-family G-like protein 1 n=1 Tax=Leptotrombidium deliense TaxID=299467 RepID=A0A443RZU8_9ACAR|nr:ABC transporter sub-family G-like protein 1 [Leptotrombidium deliense]